MSRKRIKQYLMLLTVVGLIAVAANGSGTFASFSAETTNAGNTFATGTLFLHNSANGGTACTSESATGTNFASGCSALFSLASASDFNGPNSVKTANLTLTNAGSLDASTLSFYEKNACADSSIPTIATINATVAASDPIPGGGIPVSNLLQTLVPGTPITIGGDTYTVAGNSNISPAASTSIPVTATQYTSGYTTGDAVNISADFNTPALSPTMCGQLVVSIAEGSSYSDLSNNSLLTCVYPTTSGNPTTTGCGSGTALSAAALSTPIQLDSASNPVLTSGQSRYFKIFLAAPSGLDNNAQNKEAVFDLTWNAAF